MMALWLVVSTPYCKNESGQFELNARVIYIEEFEYGLEYGGPLFTVPAQ